MNRGQSPKVWPHLVIAAAFGLFIVLPCFAHQAWILPSFSQCDDIPIWLSFDVTWGDTLFSPQKGPGVQELWVVGPADQRVSPPFSYVGKTKTVGEIELKKPGTYRIEAFKPPTFWTRVVDGKQEKWLRKSKDLVGEAKIVRSDQYWSKAVTYISAKTRTSEPLQPQSDPLELVPLDHPNKIVAGDTFRAKLLCQAKPLPNHKVDIFAEGNTGHDATRSISSDATGICEIKFSKPGKYLLVAQLERKTPQSPLADLESFGFYLLLDVSGN